MPNEESLWKSVLPYIRVRLYVDPYFSLTAPSTDNLEKFVTNINATAQHLADKAAAVSKQGAYLFGLLPIYWMPWPTAAVNLTIRHRILDIEAAVARKLLKLVGELREDEHWYSEVVYSTTRGDEPVLLPCNATEPALETARIGLSGVRHLKALIRNTIGSLRRQSHAYEMVDVIGELIQLHRESLGYRRYHIFETGNFTASILLGKSLLKTGVKCYNARTGTRFLSKDNIDYTKLSDGFVALVHYTTSYVQPRQMAAVLYTIQQLAIMGHQCAMIDLTVGA